MCLDGFEGGLALTIFHRRRERVELGQASSDVV